MTAAAPTIRPMLHAYELTPEMKAEFLELIYAGHKANTAAAEIGTTGTQFRKLKNPVSRYFDADFVAAWAEAEASDQHRVSREEDLRALVDERSRKSDTVLIKRALAELPEWEPLRHQNFHHDVNVKIAALQYVEDAALAQAIERAEAAEMGAPAKLRMLPKPEEEA